MSVPNMVGGGKSTVHIYQKRHKLTSSPVCSVVFLVALFVVILICLYNLRHYIWGGGSTGEAPNWRVWFSLRPPEDGVKRGKLSGAIERCCEEGRILKNPPFISLQPRSTTPHSRSATSSPPATSVPPAPPSSPAIQPSVAVPPTAIIKPRFRTKSDASDQSLPQVKAVPYKAPTTPASRLPSCHPSFEASTGIGMSSSYRPPVLANPPFRLQNSSDVRDPTASEFSHYFNPFAWMATQEQGEGKDLDGALEERPPHSSASGREHKEGYHMV